jgi:DNA-3-methyladenine glycosylase II
MNVSLSAPGPLDVASTLSRYRRWGEDPVNRLEDGRFRRALQVDGRWHGYDLTWTDDADRAQLTIAVPGTRSRRVVDAAVAEARHVLGLDLDVTAFYRAAAADPVLAGLIPRLRGLRPTLTPALRDAGGLGVRPAGQPWPCLHGPSSLVRRFGMPVEVAGAAVYAFPEPAALAQAAVEELRAMQFTVRKAEYIIGLAQEVAASRLDLDALGGRSNEEVIETLTRVRGFGRWTAEWFLARGLGRGDVCPAGDLGVRRAFEHFYNRGRASSPPIRRSSGEHQNWRSTISGERRLAAPHRGAHHQSPACPSLGSLGRAEGTPPYAVFC